MKEITTNKNILTENSEILKSYFKDISKYPVLSGKKQIELAKEAKFGNEKSRDKLITCNLRFVITCAKQYIGQGVSLNDLIQAGTLGLIQSIDNFNPNRGIKFLSFAVWYIRREIIKSIYNTGRTIRYPITYISKLNKVRKIYDEYLSKYQREPTEEEILNLTDLTSKQYDSVINDKSYCLSLDTPLNDDSKNTIEDVIPEQEKPYTDFFTKETISQCLKVLNSREYKVITEFYGLNGEEKCIKDIAEEMNLGDERVRQIRKSAIKKLQQRCKNSLKLLL